MNSEYWNEVQKRILYTLGHSAFMMVDGYKIHLELHVNKKLQASVMVIINGQIKYEWLTTDCEERRRFFQPVSRYVYSLKYRTAMAKLHKKHRLLPDSTGSVDFNKTVIGWYPWWNSFGGMRRHFEKNNQSIELVDEFAKDGESREVC